MRMVMCAVRDSATEMFGRPFFVTTTAQAVRSFTDEVRRKDANNDLHNHPDDFTLFQIAVFDDSNGSVEAAIQQLVRAKDIKE